MLTIRYDTLEDQVQDPPTPGLGYPRGEGMKEEGDLAFEITVTVAVIVVVAVIAVAEKAVAMK